MSLSAAVKRLGSWALIEYLVNPGLALISTPLIIYYLGLSMYGSWVVIITSGAIAGALTSGVSVALGRFIAANSKIDQNLVQRAQLDALYVMAGASILACGLVIALLHFSGSVNMDSGRFGSTLLCVVGVTVISPR